MSYSYTKAICPLYRLQANNKHSMLSPTHLQDRDIGSLGSLLFCLTTSFWSDDALRERNKVPTASNCADGNLSGPSAQHEDGAGKLDHRRHMIAVGIGRAVPTAAVGTTCADG
jgi:hypothetical protein